MPEIPSIQTNFTAGELSPRLVGRTDLAKYANGLAEQQNFLTQKHGGLMRRSGCRFVAEVKDSSKATRLIDFTFSVNQTYAIELGDLYMRFYRNKGRLQHGFLHTVTGGTWTSSVATITVTPNLVDIAVGDEISVRNIVSSGTNTTDRYNGVFIVTAIPAINQISYALTVDPGSWVSGGTVVETTGTIPTEIVSPYAQADLALVKLIQSADVMWLTHPKYQPRTLRRLAGADSDSDVWRIAAFDTRDGPYMGINSVAAATISMTSAAAGAMSTVSASVAAKAEINGGRGFEATDVGRLMTWRIVDTWSWGTITTVTHPRSAIVTMKTATAAASTDVWRMGSWSTTTGFPRCATLHKSRLWFAATNTEPQTHWGSGVGVFDSYEDFTRQGTTEGDVLDDHAIFYTIDDDRVNTIFWLASEARGLAIFTNGGGFIGAATDPFDPITPLTYTVSRQITDGVAEQASPQQASAVILFVKSGERKLLEFVFRFEADRYVAPDLTLLSEHISIGGIKETAFQSEPDNVVWAVRQDGTLLGLTYERPEDVVGWHRHVVGGTLAGEARPLVESITVIRDGADDLLWLIAKRTINGATKRYVEFMEPLFPDDAPMEDAFYVDSGLTLFSSVAISNATKTTPVVVTTAISHPFSNGQRIRVRDVKGMTQINDKSFLIADVTATTFKLKTLEGADVDGTGYGTYISSGTAAAEVTLILGLSHLAGETVAILANGAQEANKVVSGGGGITLDVPASLVHVGLPFKSRGRTMPIVPKASFETRGATMRPNKSLVFLNRSAGGRLGSHTDEYEKLDSMTLRQPETPMGSGPPIFTGSLRMPVPGRSADHVSIVVETEDPLPLNVLSLITKLEVSDV